jgi:hypothetical protein
MKISEIKKGVYNAFLTQPLEDKVDELIISCLMYDYIKKIIANENNLENNLKTLAETYLPNFKRNLAAFKESFISYDQMRQTISGYRKNSFLEFTATDIEKIIKLYQDRTQILPFSVNYFSQYMYKIINISDYHYKRLSNIHLKVMIPIIKFYVDNFKSTDRDLEVLSALGNPNNPGKEILFSIKNIDSARVVNDISTSRIPLKETRDFYNIRVYKEYVKIITN